MSGGTVSADQLRLLIERIERLEEEKQGIADDIKDVYAEAKSLGFSAPTIREIVKIRKMDTNTRREREALLDTYKAALGMLDGTPLGTWAVERLKPKAPEKKPEQSDDAAPADQAEGGVDPTDGLTVDDARRMGSEAAASGRPVTSNPFPPRDVRRAAWDEAWCAALGSDGMDIPEAWRPSQKSKGKSPAEEAA